MDNKGIRAVAFVARCSGAAMIAYELAGLLGLPESLWAAMSALIVSQERLYETRSSLTGYILGTLLGIAVTVAVSEAGSRIGAVTSAQMAVAVAISALVVRWFPSLRVAMWTCPIILLTAKPSMSIAMVAFFRGSECILGAIVGWAFHWAAEILVEKFTGAGYPLSARRAARSARN